MAPQRISHGRPYIEAERPDAISPGVPAPPQADTRDERTPDGRLTQGARTVPAMGGRATKGTTKLSHRIEGGKGLREVFAKRARTLRRALCGEMARSVGGGVCGVAPSLLLKLAAEATALAEQCLEDGDVDGHRKNADAVKMMVAYAREQCAREAEARPQREASSIVEDIKRAGDARAAARALEEAKK